ncbi:MAG: hypothetical protein RIR77_2502 [Planctomycetota bacterium]|jgi:hypothetical protein
MELSRNVPHANVANTGERKPLRGEGEGCQRACHLCFSTEVLHSTHETAHGTAASQWICRARTRRWESEFLSIGPFHRYIQWPPDVSEVSEHYWPGYGYEFGIPMHYPAGWRPFYEEQPWYNDPVQRGRILELLPPEIPPDSIQP